MCLFPPLKHLDGDPPVVVVKSFPPFPSPPFPGHLSLGFPVIAGSRVHTGNWSSVTQLCVCNPFGVFLAFLGNVSFLSSCGVLFRAVFLPLRFLHSVSRLYHASFSFSMGVSFMLLQGCTFDFLCSFSKTFPRAKHCERPTSD